MKTTDFNNDLSSKKLTENFEKQFGSTVPLEKYTREQLEDMRNKVRTRVFQHEHAAGFNDLLTNETYQKDQALLQILNTRIKEMLGEDIKKLKDKMDQLSEAKKAKPDFLDMDGDGNKTEPMKKAIKDKKASKVKEEGVEEAFGAGSTFSRSPSRLDRKKSLPAVSPDTDDEPRGGEITVPQKDREEIARILGNKDVKESKPSAGLSKAKKSATVKKAKKGGDIGKPGKGFKDVAAKAAKQYGSKEKGEKVAAAAMWKNIKRESAKNTVDIANSRVVDINREHSQLFIDEWLIRELGMHPHAPVYFDDADLVWVDKTVVPGALANEKLTMQDLLDALKTFTKGSDGTKELRAIYRHNAKFVEANAKHRQNVKFVNESLVRMINEDEEGKAKAITQASDIVNDFTGWMQRVGNYQTKTMIELADEIKANFGQDQSNQFKEAVGQSLARALETLTAVREEISRAVAVLAGEEAPEAPMGPQEPTAPEELPVDASAPDEMNPEAGDEFAASDAAAGAGTTGRELRESAFIRKLAESHSIIAKLSR